MSFQQPARGISFFDANLGRLVTEGPDVCDFKTRIRELGLDCYYDTVQEEWIVTQKNGDEETYLLADSDLGRAYERCQRARNDRPGAETADEFLRRLDREQELAQKEEMRPILEAAGDAAERLIHAFQKDGILDHENIYGPAPRKHLARRDLRVRGPRSS